MKLFFRTLLCVLTGALLLSFTGCDDDDSEILNSSDIEKTAVMKVDGIEVPLEIYRYVALNYKNDYESEAGGGSDIWLGESGAELLEELKNDVNETIISLYVTESICADYGINADDEYITEAVDTEMDEIYDGYDYDYETYVSEIAEYNMNDSVYRFLTRSDILSEELIVKMMDNGELPSDDDTLRDIIDSDEFIRVKQILISTDSGKTEEECLALAEELRQRALDGEDFDTLVQTYGNDLYMFNNFDGYYIARGSYYEEFEEASFSLEIGEISEVTETPAGYSVILRCEKEKDYIDENFDTLADAYLSGRYNLVLEEYEKTLTIEALPALDDYTIFNLDTTYDK